MQLINGDCVEQLTLIPENSVDSIVTDPPYGLKFMGKKWDYDVPTKEMWIEALRVLKPGGHLLSFSGSRTYHRMAVAIEDAGFEIRDQIMWIYGSGFPKSHNVGKAIDKLQNNERGVLRVRTDGNKGGGVKTYDDDNYVWDKPFVETKGNSKWEGWGTALKPAHEPIVLARKPLSEKTIAKNVLKWGTGGINIDECRIETNNKLERVQGNNKNTSTQNAPNNGWVSIKQVLGRFPANLIHDGSEEVNDVFPDSGNGNGKKPYNYSGREYNNKKTSMFNGDKPQASSNFNDSGSASRFFYCAKASKKERNAGLEGFENKVGGGLNGTRDQSMLTSTGNTRNNMMKNNHPTVKPLKLMEYLVRLITPPGGIVLDPFMGSGTTGIACKDFDFIGIELDEDYFKIAKGRINNA